MIEADVTSSVRGAVDAALLRRAARVALAGRVSRAHVSILVVGSARMKALNAGALGHDYAADVLSFDHGDTPDGRLVEVVVCRPVAARNARAHGVPVAQELARYIIHGCLHCAGYDDITAAARTSMWKEQERAMEALFGRAYRSQ